MKKKLFFLTLLFLLSPTILLSPIKRMSKQEAQGILDLNDPMTEERISSAYRKLALKWHPDKNPTKTKMAEEKMKEINRAHDAALWYLENPYSFDSSEEYLSRPSKPQFEGEDDELFRWLMQTQQGPNGLILRTDPAKRPIPGFENKNLNSVKNRKIAGKILRKLGLEYNFAMNKVLRLVRNKDGRYFLCLLFNEKVRPYEFIEINNDDMEFKERIEKRYKELFAQLTKESALR